MAGVGERLLIFPHLRPPKKIAFQIARTWGGFGLCLPWYLSPPPYLGEVDLKVFRPPEELMPKPDFARILSEYLAWMNEHKGEEYSAYLTSIDRMEDPSEIELAEMIRGRNPPERHTDKGLGPHLVLHLYAMTDEDSQRAELMLQGIRDTPSPLSAALDEPSIRAELFSDLPPVFPEARPSETRARQILEAWLSLFSRNLREDTALLTYEQWVLEAIGRLLRQEASLLAEDESFIRFRLPEQPSGGYRPEPSSHIAGRDLFFLKEWRPV